MKTIAQLFIVFLLIITFVPLLIVGTFKFKILNTNFWISSFEKEDVYSALSETVKSTFTELVDKEGGNKSDITVLTDLVTKENTKDFVDNNLGNIIDYLNGKSVELIVYVPISRVPGDLLPKNIAALNNEMTVKQLGEKFNMVGLDSLPIKNLGRTGDYSYYAFVVLITLYLLFLALLVWMSESGKRLISSGVSLIICGLVTLALAQVATYSVTYIGNNPAQDDVVRMIVISSAPALLTGIIRLWTYVGVGFILLGVILALIKKPDYK